MKINMLLERAPRGSARSRALDVLVVRSRHSYDVATHTAELSPLRGLGVHICPHVVCALVLDLKLPLGDLISDEEKPVFDVLAVLSRAHPSILCQQYGGLVILLESIIFNGVSLILHEVLAPHHHPENVCDAY